MSFSFLKVKLKHLEPIITDLWGPDYLNKKKFPLKTKYGEIQETSIHISHDGYDCDGPQSYIYNFAILFKDRVRNYHREYWFHGKDREPFTYLCEGFFDDESNKQFKQDDDYIMINVIDPESKNITANETEPDEKNDEDKYTDSYLEYMERWGKEDEEEDNISSTITYPVDWDI